MPNFWGCRCCGNLLVATCHSDGWIYVRNAATGSIIWSVDATITGTTTLRNIRFVSKNRLAVIDQTKFYLFDRDGSSGVIMLSNADTGSRASGGGDYGLAARNNLILVYADDISVHTGTYNPYTTDENGTVVNVYDFSSPSTLGAFDENAFQASTDNLIDSQGRGYVCGQPDVTTENESGMWRVDADGSVGLKFDSSGDKVTACIDSQDRIVAAVNSTDISLLDEDLAIVWTVTDICNDRSMTVRNQTGTFFYRASGDVFKEREIESGDLVSSYNGTYSGYFNLFRVDEKTGDFFCGGNNNQGLFRIRPSTDELIWDGFTSSDVTGIDLWQA